MVSIAKLPDYNKKAYLTGDYSDFEYYTQLIKERERICFLSSQERAVGGASKLEMTYKMENNPVTGPGYNTPLPFSYIAKVKFDKKHHSVTPLEPKTRDSLSLASSESKIFETKKKSHEEKSKFIDKAGLLWGRRLEMKIKKNQPGPADTPIKRFPENLNIKPNKVAFNTNTYKKQPLTITSIAALSPAETYKHIDLFKSSFEARKELNIPLILCPKVYRDVCAKCKNQIYENYFYVKENVRICRRCYNNGLKSTNFSEKYSYRLFKPGRYCSRYHNHHKVKGYDNKLSKEKMYKLFRLEVYHQQYTGFPEITAS